MTDYEIKLMRNINKLNNFMEDKSIEYQDLTLELIEEFVLQEFKSSNRAAIYNNIKILNQILKDNNVNIKIESSDYVNELVKSNSINYYTLNEIQHICNSFINASDSFIIYALYNNLRGKEFKDILNIKTSDVADDNSYIMINNSKFICDDYMQKLLKVLRKEDIYIKNMEIVGTNVPDYYAYNMDSEYLLKTIKSKRNNNGLSPMKRITLQTRLIRLSDMFYSNTGIKINLSATNLATSKILYEMFVKETTEGVVWDMPTIELWFKEMNYKGNSAEIFRKYKLKYHNED